ncbi:MAG: molybdopterin-dependent oxidoreductase [Vulcanimicrobiaceae bacterium]
MLQSSRGRFLVGGAATLAGTSLIRAIAQAAPMVKGVFANGDRELVAFPQKRPLMVLSPRPPLLETPFKVFDEGVFTPNDAFFVRWHLAGIPTSIDTKTFRLSVKGATDRTLSLSLDDLRHTFEPVEIAAVNQCSGNSRGFFGPRVTGGEWQNGAMGNALWKGVRLKDILAKAGLKADAKQVQFNGLETPVLPQTPDFKKSLDLEVANSPDVIVAYEMNGKPLPVLNGFPLRLVVPGWFSTYWMKMLFEITVLDKVDDQFWMKTAYRIPAINNGNVLPTDEGYATVPINVMRVRSFVTNVTNGEKLRAGDQILRGIAFDGGSGIKTVEYSLDGGKTYTAATLEEDHGKFSFRRWNAKIALEAGKTYTIACRATGNDGGVQTNDAFWNPGGYMRNSIESYEVSVA